MSTQLWTSVDSASIVGGVWQERASNLGILEQSRLIPTKRGRGNLYVLVETVGSFPDHEQIQQRIIGIVREYYRTPGSITAGIRHAIKAANTYLFEENLTGPREQRGVAGVTCMVLKDQDAYIGQCGPAALYHVGKARFQRLPKESTWLSSEMLQDVDIRRHPPLGLRREIEPELFHLHVREADVFVLSSRSLARLASDEEIAHAILDRGAHSVRANVENLARGQDLSLIVIEVLAADQAPVSGRDERVYAQPLPSPQPSLLTKVSSGLRRLFVTPMDEREGFEEEFDEEEEGGGPGLDIDLRAAAESAWRFLTGLGRQLAALLVRVLPDTDSDRRSRRARKGKEVAAAQLDRRWLYAALVIPILVIVLVAVTRFQHQRSLEAQFAELVGAAQEAIAAAESSPDRSAQRTLLTQAMGTLGQALELKPEAAELKAEQQGIQDWLDRLDSVYRIPYFIELQEFPDTETATAQLSRVVVHGIDVYVLDLGVGRVYKYLLNDTRDALQKLEGDPVLLRRGDQRGDVTVDELLDIAWVDAGGLRGTSNLLTVDTQGHVLMYDALLELRPFPTADTSTWRNPVAAVGYFGRVYLLDPQANHVLRYVLTNEGYDGPPSNYFPAETDVSLSSAVDVAIDGNVYILHSNGVISKYQEGSPVPFAQSNMDKSLQAPRRIFVTGFMDEGGYVYVADAGNQRIVQFSKAGEFIQQFRGRDVNDMRDLRGLFVDEEQKQLFLTDGSKLYLVALPD